MTASILAVYQDGILRPDRPLPLAEGETVAITWTRSDDSPSSATQEDAVRRIRAAKTLEEWIKTANAMPVEENGYDLLQALEENRNLSGDERRLFAGHTEGDSR